jgi:light-regulated signal transduction histidine kinase (bacteriophytochrome)
MSAAGLERADHDATLDACAREPIHLPGAIQPHGILLALSEPAFEILRVSRSVRPLLGIAEDDLLGRPLSSIVDPNGFARIRRALARDRPEDACVAIELGGRRFDATVHRSGGGALLEAEPHQDRASAIGETDRQLVGFDARLEDAPDLDALAALATREIRALTGFGRVMFYQFEADDHGWVRAEDRAPDETSYLGLHFPASDIPAQARALYVRNPIRVIPDRCYEPSPIVPAEPPLDLSAAALRSVSPVHLEYLGNMGVRASMSVSIVRDGRLVALIACHDRSVRHVAPSVRAACLLIARLVGLHLAGKQAREGIARRRTTSRALADLHARFAAVGLQRGLATSGAELLDLTGATGVAFVFDGEIHRIGETPSEDGVARIVAALGEARDDPAQATAGTEETVHAHDALSSVVSLSSECTAAASGLLAIAIPKPSPDWILWFRPEVVRTVAWAGDPRKAVEGTAARPHPRRSFELWKQTVVGTARPWSTLDLEAASRLRRLIVEVDLAEQVSKERSARANAEAAERRVAFLAEASAILARELDEARILDHVATLAVPRLGAGLIVDLVEDGDHVERAIVRFDAPRNALAQRIREWSATTGIAAMQIARDGRPLTGPIEAETLRPLGMRDSQIRFVGDELGMRSFVGLPLVSRDRTLGALFLLYERPIATVDPHDVELARELARRAAAAIDNARLYSAAQAATADAERAVRAREDLVAVVSHDLKNPVAAIDLEAARLQKKISTVPPRDAGLEPVFGALERISRATRRMSGLINDLLDVAKIEAGRFLIEPTPHALGPLLDDALEILAPLATARGIDLASEVEDRTLEVRVERERVFQIVSNLVGNALKFTPSGGRVLVQAAARRQERCVRIEVRDTGKGLGDADPARIFDRYWQAAPSERGRVGLGLFIVRGLVEAHGGRVGVESAPGQGSTFWFTLPLA